MAFANNDSVPKTRLQRKALGKCARLVNPQPNSLHHEATPLLRHYADHRCPVDCGEDWSVKHIEALLKRGPHISAKDPKAIKYFMEEVDSKVKNGYAKVVRYGDIRKNLPRKLKLPRLC